MAAAAGAQGQQAIPLSSLDLDDLNNIKQRAEADLEHLTSSLEVLGAATQRFNMGKEALQELLPPKVSPGRHVLVPMTSSLYVPAMLENTETVLVDVGAKYYIRKSINGAIDYNTRRAATIKGQMEKIEAAAQNKQRLLEGVVVTMQQKLRAQQAGQS
eukprot:m51a1_g4904 hypothetical protein (158) ;mRNA; r:163189-163962